MSHLTHSDTDQRTANGSESGNPSYSRIRVNPTSAAMFRAFLEKHGAEVDEALPALIEFYESQTEHRHSAETGHLLAELRKLDASITTLVQTNLHLVELARCVQQAELLRSASQIKTSIAKD